MATIQIDDIPKVRNDLFVLCASPDREPQSRRDKTLGHFAPVTKQYVKRQRGQSIIVSQSSNQTAVPRLYGGDYATFT